MLFVVWCFMATGRRSAIFQMKIWGLRAITAEPRLDTAIPGSPAGPLTYNHEETLNSRR